MVEYEKIKNHYYWLNVIMVVPALLLAGATVAILYLAVPLFFALIVVVYVFKFSLEIWVWRKLPPEARREYREPCRFMNYNFVLSAKMEWFLFSAGFLALVLWV
ncbi:MAG: hypothetical protein AAGG72_09940 [Pseudomonadota bacterium]